MSTVAPPSSTGRVMRAAPAVCGVPDWCSCRVIIVVAALVAVFGPMFTPFDPNQVNLSNSYVGSTGSHFLGFDGQGRDLFSRLLVGARTSLIGPLAVVAFAIVLGTLIAIATAWKGGRFDTVSSTGLDILFAFPGILLAVLAAAVFGAGLTAASLALAWPTCRTSPESCEVARCASETRPTSPPSRCRASRDSSSA